MIAREIGGKTQRAKYCLDVGRHDLNFVACDHAIEPDFEAAHAAVDSLSPSRVQTWIDDGVFPLYPAGSDPIQSSRDQLHFDIEAISQAWTMDYHPSLTRFNTLHSRLLIAEGDGDYFDHRRRVSLYEIIERMKHTNLLASAGFEDLEEFLEEEDELNVEGEDR
jgi:hypothetical protein